VTSNLKLGNSVFCEYVGRGEGGKFLLINVYSGDVVIPIFPARLVGAVYFEFFPGDRKNLDVKLEIFRGEIKIFEAMTHFVETKTSEPAIISTPQFLIQFDQPAKLRSILTIKGFRTITVMTKEVRLGPISLPTAQ
jgi:hypothetical protein